jgi:superfamily II DNA or RNA helicase
VIDIYVHTQQCFVKGLKDQDREELSEMLSFPIANSFEIRRYKLAQCRERIREANKTGDMVAVNRAENDKDYWTNWDGKVKYLKKDNSFPLGFLRRVKYFVYALGEIPSFRLIDKRIKPKMLFKQIEFTGELRQYQETVVDQSLNEPMGIFNLATGSGKTVVAIALISRKNTQTVVVVPTLALLNQWIDKLKQFSTAHIGFKSSKQLKEGDVFIITQSSLNKALTTHSSQDKTQARYEIIKRIWREAGMVIIDESHHASAKTWKAMMSYTNAYYRFGLTATTDKRTDKADYEYYALLGDKLSVIDYSDLLELGYSIPIEVFFYDIPYRHYNHKWKFHQKGGFSVENDYIVENNDRNDQIVNVALDRAFRRDKPTLILFKRVTHGEVIYNKAVMDMSRPDLQIYNDLQIKLVYGKTKEKERNEIYQEFKDKQVKLLIAQNQLIGEGWDMPNIEVIIIASGGKSEIRSIQNMGRGSRQAHKKKTLEIHDFADQGKYVQDHARERAKTYEEIGAKMINIDNTTLSYLF